MEYLHTCPTPLGEVTLSGDGEALTGLWFQGQKYFGSTLSGEETEKPLPLFDRTEEWLTLYFSGRDPGFLPPLRPRGTPFQRRVWGLLQRIPYGQTATYGDLARQLARETGGPSSPRAVGGAVGRNPISLLIPCHRVLGAGDSLTGYAGGLDRKSRLLELEGVDLGRRQGQAGKPPLQN